MYNTILGIVFLILFLVGLSWKISILIHKWLLDYSYDTSCVTEGDIILFMRNEKMFSEEANERKKYATKILSNFISTPKLWKKSTEHHYHYKGCCIFFGHKKTTIKESVQTEGKIPFDKNIIIENDNEDFKGLIKTARKQHKKITKEMLA